MAANIVQFINFTAPAPNTINLPYAWMAFKSWFEDNSQAPELWTWPEPMVTDDYPSIDAIMEHLVSQGEPRVICFSQYQWNYLLQDEIARRCSELWPHSLIFYGGPQQSTKHDIEWFKKYPWVDGVCAEGGYGEPVLTQILDSLAQGSFDISQIPNIRYPGHGRLVQMSTARIDVRSFKWVPVFQRHKDYIKKVVDYHRTQNQDVFINLLYEGSRGCPYGCAFCEWGLYTNSKVNFKPLELMLEDIEILKEVDIDRWDFIDANLGSRQEDVDIVRSIIEQRGSKTYPKVIGFYSAKNNKKKLIEIQGLILDAGMPTDMVLSVQDQDLGVKKAIDRIDLDWYKTLELYKPLFEKHKPKVAIDLILGLPGSTIDTHYQGYDKTLMLQRAVHPAWINEVLDLSPQNEPDYYHNWNIEIIENDIEYSILGWLTSGLIVRVDKTEQILPKHLTLDPKYRSKAKYVVACKSFSREDFAEMFMTDRMTYSLDGNDSLYGITRYLWNHLEVNPSQFVRALWNEFFLEPQWLPYIHPLISSTFETFKNRLHQKEVRNFEYFQWLDDPNTQYKPELLFWLAVLMNPQGFYASLEKWLETKEWIDEPLRDLVNFTAQMIKTIDYDPTQGKLVASNYDWIQWLSSPEKQPVKSNLIYRASDTHYGPVNKLIDWQDKTALEKFSYIMVELAHDVPYSIFFQKLQKVNT